MEHPNEPSPVLSMSSADAKVATPRKPTRLRVEAIGLASKAEMHASQKDALRAIAHGRRGFVDLRALPRPVAPATLVLSADDGTRYALDASGPKPVLRPLVKPPSGGEVARETAPETLPAETPQPRSEVTPGFGEQLLAQAGQALAADFLAAFASGRSVGDVLGNALGSGNLVGAAGSEAISGLGEMLMGSMVGQLLGSVDDASSAGAQIAARFGPQLANSALAGVGSISTPPGAGALQQKLTGVVSKASIPLGLGVGPSGARVVVNGSSGALIDGDEAMHGTPDDVAPFTGGNPKVLINGKPAIGKKHFAICPKHGAPVHPVHCSPNVLIGENPPPPPPPPAASNEAGLQQGDACTPSPTLDDQLAENEEGGIGRPLECRPDEAAGGEHRVQRAAPWDPGAQARGLLGIENVASPDAQAQGIDRWSILWGAISIGSPQEPGAGTRDSWAVPDRIFGHDMSPYYLLHDRIFRDDRSLAQFGEALDAEGRSFLAGIAGRPNAGLQLLQLIYSGASTTTALTNAIRNSVNGRDGSRAKGDVGR